MGRITEGFAVAQGRARRRLTSLDACKVYSRATGWAPNSIGPLDKRYDPTGLSRRQQKAGRMVQLIDLMRKAYETGDRAAYDRLVRPFDSAATAIEGKGWGRDVRELTFPEWTSSREHN